ncbi:MAG: ABC transporter ATP-binding protein [Tunicatimonas sp.]|uniref:ABC transporter ATP-binding protein n=1 Tax=Tunicatimonas sp. TaxID=1940096 RepID=UPI003C724B28
MLNRISLNLATGECWCIVGVNGAGKTTLLRCILNAYPLDEGVITVNNLDSVQDSVAVKSIIGVVADINPLINEFTVYQYLQFIGRLHRLNSAARESRIQSLTSYFFTDPTVLSQRIQILSTGNRQRVGLCGALLHQPKVLLLDEPFAGLDLETVHTLISFLKDYLLQGGTILMTSHNPERMQRLATHVAILNAGRMTFTETMENLTQNHAQEIDEILLEQMKNG